MVDGVFFGQSQQSVVVERSSRASLAARVLVGTKTWTLVVVLSLALGIGANTALFTAVNALLLQTVNVHEPERL